MPKRKRVQGIESRKIREVNDEPSQEDVGPDDQIGSQPDADVSAMEQDEEEQEGDGEWGGISEGARNQPTEDDHEPGTIKKKPPTGEELRTIKDATNLFKSSSFKLQVDALLPNVRPKASRVPPLERFLLVLHSFLMGLPSIAPQHPLEASRYLLKKGVSVPYPVPLPTEETKWKVAFEKPSDITMVGSWPNKVSVKAKDGYPFGVDVAIEMPDALFQEKDYLNGRFFHKRAFYLATVAAAIKQPQSCLNVDVLYDSFSDDPRLTKLILIPNKDGSQDDFTKLNARVCVIPVLSSKPPIPLHRLAPSQSNIRINAATLTNDKSNAPTLATPMYNTAILLALTPRRQLLATHAIKEDSSAFVDALTLLRVWGNQRGYGPGSKLCIQGFEARGSWWSALLCLLIAGEERVGVAKSAKRKPLARGLSSYQLFRRALDFLSKHDFEKDPVFLKVKDGQHQFSPEEYKECHDAVFVDSSSLVNLLAGVSIGSLELLRHDAAKTLETLDNPSTSGDPFMEVFLTDHRDLPTRFDAVVRVDLSTAKPLSLPTHAVADAGSPANALISSISSILRKGLGDRTKAVTILLTPSSPRPLSQAHPFSPDTIYIGIIYNPSNAFRLVDHGPAADEGDSLMAQMFRDFWGDKAELRRFKDGRILESVVWDVKTADERAHVPTMIVRHLLRHHFGLTTEAIRTWQTSFDSLLCLPETISSIYRESGTSTGFKAALTAFDNLVKQIKNLDSAIPLAVLNVSPVSEQLRYTSVFSPVPLPSSLASVMPATARYLGLIEAVLEFEQSSRWPDDLKAIQKMKLAFFERIASELMKKVQGLRASVAVGDGVRASEIVDKASLEIVTPDGWAFCIRIWNAREVVLLDRVIEEKNRFVPSQLKQQKKGEGEKKAKMYREVVEAKEVYTRRFIHAPRHHRAIAALCHRRSAFAGTARLVKRWLASHWLLHGHISEEIVEIICAKFFIGDGTGVDGDNADVEGKRNERADVPGSKERGFAAVVAFLKDWKWEEGVFVPLYGSGNNEENGLAKYLKAGAGAPLSAGVWRVSTELDEKGWMWASHGPDAIVANRVTALAKATWDLLQGMETGVLDVQAMFIHPTDDYDFIVHLNPRVIPRYFHNITVNVNMLSRHGKFANVSREDQDVVVRPGFDPAQLLFTDLQRIYTHTFKLFHDSFGGNRFGVVWDPSLKEPRPFRVLGQFSSAPVKKESEKGKDKNLVVLNETAILSEIERLGTGLVEEFTIHDRV